MKQTLETLREDLTESERVRGKAFERLKKAFLAKNTVAMVVVDLCISTFFFLLDFW